MAALAPPGVNDLAKLAEPGIIVAVLTIAVIASASTRETRPGTLSSGSLMPRSSSRAR